MMTIKNSLDDPKKLPPLPDEDDLPLLPKK
jgi:hypothetical protein